MQNRGTVYFTYLYEYLPKNIILFKIIANAIVAKRLSPLNRFSFNLPISIVEVNSSDFMQIRVFEINSYQITKDINCNN